MQKVDEADVVKEEARLIDRIRTLIDGDRIINFSDAVFAFAATLLIIRIDFPSSVSQDLIRTDFWQQLALLIPVYGANFFSFLIIAYYWRMHHKLFILITKYDIVLTWINVLILIFVAILPFPIDLFGQFSDVPDVIVFYTISLSIIGYLLVFLWLYASYKHRLIKKTMSDRVIRYITISTAIAPVIFTLSIPLAYLHHLLAKISWILVIILLLLFNSVYKINPLEKERFDKDPE